jgi:hypothetical protein
MRRQSEDSEALSPGVKFHEFSSYLLARKISGKFLRQSLTLQQMHICRAQSNNPNLKNAIEYYVL